MQAGNALGLGEAWHGPVIRRDMNTHPVTVWMNRQRPRGAELASVFSGAPKLSGQQLVQYLLCHECKFLCSVTNKRKYTQTTGKLTQSLADKYVEGEF